MSLSSQGKQIVRTFMLDKMRDTTTFDLHELAFKYELDSFAVAECFDYEAYRIEKFFNFPQDGLPDPINPNGFDNLPKSTNGKD
jgi:hypothetical protein